MSGQMTNEEMIAALEAATAHAARASAAFQELGDGFHDMLDSVAALRESIQSRVSGD